MSEALYVTFAYVLLPVVGAMAVISVGASWIEWMLSRGG